MSTTIQHLSLSLTALLLATSFLACGDEEEEGSGEAVETVSLGSVTVGDLNNDNSANAVTVSVPSGAESVVVVFDGAPAGALIAIERITAPDGTVVFDLFNGPSTNRVDTSEGLYSILIPNNPAVPLTEGDWKIIVVTQGSEYTVNGTAIIKNEAGSGAMDLNLFFAGVDGLDAATAPMDADFQAAVSNVGTIYGTAGITIGDINYIDITDEALAVVEGDAELATLFRTSASQSNRALNFYFVKDLVGNDAGFTLLGKAGGVPGPSILHGTAKSGVVVNMGNYISAKASGDAAMLTDALSQVEIIMAHEAAHYLGLYHTVERNGTALDENGITGTDPLDDTMTCPDSADANGDMVLAPSECAGQGSGNLMFWSPPNDARTLTSSQGTVLRKNPALK